MLHVCPDCGDHAIEKPIVEAEEPHATATCPACEATFEFPYAPLFSVEGAPGVGKSSIVGYLSDIDGVVVYDGDLHIGLTNGRLSWASICSLDFRVCMSFHAAGQRALMIGGMYPHDPEDSPESRYFSRIERCALVCDDAVLRERLQARPEMEAEDIEWTVGINEWYREQAPAEGIDTIDTGSFEPSAVAERVREWVESRR